MSIARQYGQMVERVNHATDKDISKALDKQPPTLSDVLALRDAEIARLKAEVARLTMENAELRAANMGANKANAPANAANTDRKAYQRELMRKRRAAAKANGQQ